MSRESWGSEPIEEIETIEPKSNIPVSFIKRFLEDNFNLGNYKVLTTENESVFSINIDVDILSVLTNKLQFALWDSRYFNVSVIVQDGALIATILQDKESKVIEINNLISSIHSVDEKIDKKNAEIKILQQKHDIKEIKNVILNKKPRIIL
jgi:hypothetical protein